MPYIQQKDRPKYDKIINQCVNLFIQDSAKESDKDNCACLSYIKEGELNYVFSSILWNLFNNFQSYQNANKLMGVLECVKLEFYRRLVSTYEDTKIESNGDLEWDLFAKKKSHQR